jgi:hypothetical protein
MKRLIALCGVLSALLVSTSARADNFTTFNIVANLSSGSVTGTVTEDTTTGNFTDSNISASYNGLSFTFSGAPVLEDQEPDFDLIHFGNDPLHPGYYFATDFYATALIGYPGGALCSTQEECSEAGIYNGISFVSGIGNGDHEIVDPVTSGSLIPSAAATPEPSSLALIATGLIAGAEAVRRHRKPGCTPLNIQAAA